MLIITTNIVKYTLLYTVDTVKYSMNEVYKLSSSTQQNLMRLYGFIITEA